MRDPGPKQGGLGSGVVGDAIGSRKHHVDAAEIGERWRVGTSLLEVCGPRIPCATFAGHMGEPRWVTRFTARERVGAYLGVAEAGVIEPGDPIEVVQRPRHGLTVPMFFRAAMGDTELAARFLDARVLPQVEHEWLASRT